MTPSLFAVYNLTEAALFPCDPWEFKAEKPSAQICGDKQSRQDWYQSPATLWNFYTAVEPANPSQRVSKNNPPRKLHGFVADIDLPLTDSRVTEATEKMRLKPAYWERSLGGNVRLIFLFARPLIVEQLDFAIFILQEAKGWLQLGLFPGLDEGAIDPCRLFCNGLEFHATGAEPIAENETQKFFFDCGAKFNFKDCGNAAAPPLDIVEAEIKKQFPNWAWPGPFELGSQGSSWWVPGSVSTQSAIVKAEGMFTFSAHADRPFYPWSAILGDAFAKQYETNSVAEATKDIFHDGRDYWVFNEVEHHYIAMSERALSIRLKVRARVSTKPDKLGTSAMDRCLEHIQNYNHVTGGAPMLFYPPGLVRFAGQKICNTASKSNIVIPSDVPAVWGPSGNLPFLSELLDSIFDPPSQKIPFLAWLRYFYVSAFNMTPKPGQNVVICGGAGVGKTLLSRSVVGGLLGAFCDASKHLVGDESFNSALFESPLWVCDDESPLDTETSHRKYSSFLKMAAANQSHSFRKKFHHDLCVPWMGRIFVSANLDASSRRAIPALDVSILDKISIFACVAEPTLKFPDRDEITRLLRNELPNFARWLVDWKIPEEWVGDSRYGVRSFHEQSLVDSACQSSKASPFREIVGDFLVRWFADNLKATEYRASVTQLLRALHGDPTNESIMRSLKLSECHRYLETLEKEDVLKCRSENGPRQTREWVFPRFETESVSDSLVIPPMTACSLFTR